MIVALLLAAGSGSRLGQPKALAQVDGETLLARCTEVLLAGGADEVRVVLDEGLAPPPAVARRPGVHIVLHPHPERGQTSSLKMALQADLGEASGLMLHTVDHALATRSDVAALLQAFEARAAPVEIVVPSVAGRRGHPAVYAARLADEFRALGDDQPAHRVLRRDPGRVHHLIMQNPWLVRDIDTAGDLEEARRAWALRGPEPA